jgi:anthranilate/para-aminobenzoate synthase component I
MSEPAEIAVKTIDHPGVDPLEAYAKLRSYTPGRGSFLLESRAPETPAGRYSVVGYRVRQMELMPPGIDAITGAGMDLEAAAAPETFAQAMAAGMVGYLSAGSATLGLGVGLCDDEGPGAHFVLGATVMVFDHQRDEVVVAGPSKGNLVERCIWEVSNGPEIAPLATPEGDAEPTDLRALLADETLAAKAVRAKPYLDDEIDSLVLAQTLVVPCGKTSAFDVYRALGASSQAAQGYFVDFGQAPGAPEAQIAGFGDTTLHLRRRGDRCSMAEALGEALPHPNTTGQPPAEAHKLIRRLEDNSRQLWGGAVGYLCPGGEAAFVLADEVISAMGGNYWCTVGATLTADTDGMSIPAAARQAARRSLAAIRAAQLAVQG